MLRHLKYEIPVLIGLPVAVAFPVGANITRIDCQHGRLMAWAIVDDGVDTLVDKIFEVYMTGEEIRLESDWLSRFFHATVLMPSGFVLHVWEVFK